MAAQLVLVTVPMREMEEEEHPQLAVVTEATVGRPVVFVAVVVEEEEAILQLNEAPTILL
jgi:hypothetical protein